MGFTAALMGMQESDFLKNVSGFDWCHLGHCSFVLKNSLILKLYFFI
jgi:hypothetical protein